jgi:hypothetical protein
MARNFLKGIYTPQNPEKYTGDHLPVYRSSWELEFCKTLDLTPGVLEWASEPVQIPYQNPLNGRQTVYVPDYYLTQVQQGEKVSLLVEVKPLKETFDNYARTSQDAMIQARNRAKWAAAMVWCERRSAASGHPVRFEIFTEADMFKGGKAILPSKRTIKPLVMQGTVAKKKMRPAKAKRVRSALAKVKAKANRHMLKLGRKPRVARIRGIRRIKPL